jgi:hypothetical protein
MSRYDALRTQRKLAARSSAELDQGDGARRDAAGADPMRRLQRSLGNQVIERLARAGGLPSPIQLRRASSGGNQALQRLLSPERLPETDEVRLARPDSALAPDRAEAPGALERSRVDAAGVPIVQRAVGIEFEIDNVRSYSKNLFDTPKDLKKKDKIVKGRGFALEADEMPGHSNMEFVTSAFPETPDGGEALNRAVDGIAGIIQTLTGQIDTEVSANALAAYGTPVTNRFLLPKSAPFIGKPQVTAGVRLDKLDDFFEAVALRQQAPAASPNAAVVFGGQMTPNTMTREAFSQSSGVGPVATARQATHKALVQIHSEVQLDDPSNPVIGGPELRALVTQLVMYLVRGAVGVPGYGKTIAGEFMGRTDFAKLFKLLPEDKRQYFEKNPQKFARLVLIAAKDAAWHGEYKGQMAPAGPVFEGKLYNDPLMYGTSKLHQQDLLPQLRRDQWLLGIVGGTDLLTATSYPGKKKHREEIESLGGYGANVDELSLDARYSSPAPIVEFRGLKPLYAGLFAPFAFDMFRYIHTINTGGREGYPGRLLDMTQNDQYDLIMHQGNHAQLRAQAVQEALDEIQWW